MNVIKEKSYDLKRCKLRGPYANFRSLGREFSGSAALVRLSAVAAFPARISHAVATTYQAKLK
jgi:hypothetical protein